MCVQLLKAWGAHVTVTCSHNAELLVRHLGADFVVEGSNYVLYRYYTLYTVSLGENMCVVYSVYSLN